jgi:hypothetical protein
MVGYELIGKDLDGSGRGPVAAISQNLLGGAEETPKNQALV